MIRAQGRRAERLLAISLAMLACVMQSRALDSSWPVKKYLHEVIGKKQGLPQLAVYDIAQSIDGYLWFGTEEGLGRYDGVRMVVYNSSSTPALPGNLIEAVVADPDGGLWVGTDQGLARIHQGQITNLTKLLGQSATAVHKLSLTPDGSLWVASDMGVHRISNGSVLNYTVKDGLPEGTIRALLALSGQSAWIGTTRGLVHLEGSHVQVFTTQDGLPHNEVQSLCVDRDGSVWVGTTGGLACYRQGGLRVVGFPKEMGGKEVRVLLRDEGDALWIGCSSGVIRLKADLVERMEKQDGLADNFVVSLMKDRDGSLWVGTQFGGVSHLRNPTIAVMGVSEGLASENVACVLEGRDHSLWVGLVESGLDRIKDGRIEHFSTKDGLPSNLIRSFCESPQGVLWVGTSAGLVRFDGRGFVPTSSTSGAPGDSVFAIEVDRTGALWVGTRVGIWRLDHQGWRHFEPAEGVPWKPILAIHQGRDGTLWIGTDGSGVIRYVEQHFEQFSTAKGLAGSQVLDIYEDEGGVVWISTDQGISRFKNGSFQTIDRKHGLLSDANFRVLGDGHGNLWMSSNLGISRVKKRDMDLVADGQSSQVTQVAYGTDDGMKEAECNGAVQPAGWHTADGRLWFPTSQGLAIVNPQKPGRNSAPPRVVLEELWTDKLSWPVQDGLSLPPTIGQLQFRFTAPTYVSAERAQFKYRLQGLETEWHDGETRREATYVNLPPGGYVFNVIAADAHGVWNQQGASIAFTKLPYFHQTKWFYVLCGVALAMASWGAHRWRVRQLRRAHRLLEARVEQRTAQLQNEIEERKRMELEVERIHRQLLDASHQAGQAEVATSVLHNVGNVLNSVNVSTTLMAQRINGSRIGYLTKVTELLHERQTDLPRFLTEDVRGRQLVPYLEQLALHLRKEQEDLLAEVKSLAENVEHIRRIVVMQQSYAKVAGVTEEVVLADLVENALKVDSAAFQRHSVEASREYEEVPTMVLDKHRLLHILVNLVQNAKHACQEAGNVEKRVQVRVKRSSEQRVRIEVADNGIGIDPENMKRLFAHGFTTKKDGHGFGLHSAALAAKELGGSLTAYSNGLGKGATFILELPIVLRRAPDEYPTGASPNCSTTGTRLPSQLS